MTKGNPKVLKVAKAIQRYNDIFGLFGGGGKRNAKRKLIVQSEADNLYQMAGVVWRDKDGKDIGNAEGTLKTFRSTFPTDIKELLKRNDLAAIALENAVTADDIISDLVPDSGGRGRKMGDAADSERDALLAAGFELDSDGNVITDDSDDS